MGEIQNRLAELRGDMSQSKFAKSIGLSQQNYWKYENGKQELKSDLIEKICRTYNCSAEWLLGLSAFAPGVPNISNAFVPVPLYGSVSGGIPIEMIEDMEIKEAPARFLEDDPDCFFARMKGNSENRKGIFDGDYVLISPKHRDPGEGGLFFVAVNGDEATLKEVNVLENGVELVPDSYDPTYTRQIYDFNDPSTPSVEIRGKYVWHCAPF